MFGNNLKRLRLERNMTQEELGDKLGVSYRTVSSWEINRTEPNMGTVQKIAELFGVKTDELIYDNNSLQGIKNIIPLPRLKPIPFYSLLSCGKGNFQDEQPIDYLSIPTFKMNAHKEYFSHIADGDSMINANINEGDILVFEKCNVPQENKIGSFVIGDGVATCKRFKKIDGKAYLMPANDNYMPIEVNEETRMIGLLAFVLKDYREM